MPPASKPKRFGVLGSGDVGQTLARGLMGTAKAARAIEPLGQLWCIPGFLHNDWQNAFGLLRPAR